MADAKAPLTKYLMEASPERRSRQMKPASTYVGSDMSSNDTKKAITSVETAMPIMPVMMSSSRP